MEELNETADRLLRDKLASSGISDGVLSARRRIRQPRAYDARGVCKRSAVDCSHGRNLVQQQFRDEADVNTIVRRFGLTPQSRPVERQGVYGDFTGITDYESAVAAIERARRSFGALPPDVRERYGNDPGRFLDEASQLSEEELDGFYPAPEEPVADATLRDVVDAVREAVKPPKEAEPPSGK